MRSSRAIATWTKKKLRIEKHSSIFSVGNHNPKESIQCPPRRRPLRPRSPLPPKRRPPKRSVRRSRQLPADGAPSGANRRPGTITRSGFVPSTCDFNRERRVLRGARLLLGDTIFDDVDQGQSHPSFTNHVPSPSTYLARQRTRFADEQHGVGNGVFGET